VDIGHDRDPLVDEGELGRPEYLLAGLLLERDAPGPGLDRDRPFLLDQFEVHGHLREEASPASR